MYKYAKSSTRFLFKKRVMSTNCVFHSNAASQNYAKQPPKIIENQSLAINKLEVAYSAPTWAPVLIQSEYAEVSCSSQIDPFQSLVLPLSRH